MTTTPDEHFDLEELAYCIDLVTSHGDSSVGHDPKNIASYLRIQAINAYRIQAYEVAARLGHAATLINCDARNNHTPDWYGAAAALISGS